MACRRTAICRGAVFKGFLDGPGSSAGENGTSKVRAPVNVVTTVARQSLGIEMRDIFEEGVHLEKDKEWDQVYEVHIKGAYSCTKAAWTIFRKQKFGRIVNTASAAGLYGTLCHCSSLQ